MKKSTLLLAVLFFFLGAIIGIRYAEKYNVSDLLPTPPSPPGDALDQPSAGRGEQPPKITETPMAESMINNLSFPVIFSDNVRPARYVDIGMKNWTFAGIADPETDCAQEDNSSAPVPIDLVCYYGRPYVIGKDGSRQFIGDPAVDKKVWWLQRRQENRWQAFDPVQPTLGQPLVVTAVDWNDRLEGSDNFVPRAIPVEITLFADIANNPAFQKFVAFNGGPCNAAVTPDRCFAAFNMSGAVPGTANSEEAIEGTDYGFGTGAFPGAQTLIDPTTLYVDETTGTGFHATVYSGCARLLIQQINGEATLLNWSSTLGRWIDGAEPPIVDVAAYDGQFSAKSDAAGVMRYSHLWDARNVPPGKFRLTFVLDGPPRCPIPLNTAFQNGTRLANPGTIFPGMVVSKKSLQNNYGGDGYEGGLAFLDITLRAAEEEEERTEQLPAEAAE